MKIMRAAIVTLVVLMFSAPWLHAQDLSKYRNFSMGMSLADLSKQIGANPTDVTVIHQHPALIQELTWWPRVSGQPGQPEAIREILFSFYDGKLYKIFVTYDDAATLGMSHEDRARAISAKYGTPTTPDVRIGIPKDGYPTTEQVMDRWEDSRYSVNLFRSSFSSSFGLVLFSKQVNAEAEAATHAAFLLEQQGAPQREADRIKKEADVLEASRVKNLKTFHP